MGFKSSLKFALGEKFFNFFRKSGVALIAYGVLVVAITNALSLLINNLNAAPSDMINFLKLCGVGDGISIIGAAIFTRNAFDAKITAGT